MNRFSKSLIVALALGCISFPVFAQNSVLSGFRTTAGRAQLSGLCTTSPTACLVSSVGIVINVALSLLGIVLLAYVMWGGLTWMTAGGDMEKTKEARSRIINAVAGIVIVAASYVIAAFVIARLNIIVSGQTTSSGGANVQTPVTPSTPTGAGRTVPVVSCVCHCRTSPGSIAPSQSSSLNVVNCSSCDASCRMHCARVQQLFLDIACSD